MPYGDPERYLEPGYDPAEEDLDPETIRMLIERGLLDEEEAYAMLQRKEGAERAQMSQQPEGNMVSGIYVPPSPLEYIAPLGQQIAGGIKEGQAENKIEAIRKRKRETSAAPFKLYGFNTGE